MSEMADDDHLVRNLTRDSHLSPNYNILGRFTIGQWTQVIVVSIFVPCLHAHWAICIHHKRPSRMKM